VIHLAALLGIIVHLSLAYVEHVIQST